MCLRLRKLYDSCPTWARFANATRHSHEASILNSSNHYIGLWTSLILFFWGELIMQPRRAMALTRAHFRQAHWSQRQAPISTRMGQYAALSMTSHARVRLPAVAIPAPVIQQWGWRLWTCAQGAIKTASISHSKHLPRSQTLMPVVWPLAPKSTYFLLSIAN
jgi:hypothetical protein